MKDKLKIYRDPEFLELKPIPANAEEILINLCTTYPNAVLAGGTLLGIIREKRLLPYDSDIDLHFLNEYQSIPGRAIYQVYYNGLPMQKVWDINDCLVDFHYYWKLGFLGYGNVSEGGLVILPSRFTNKKQIKFKGVKLNTPSNLEEYLTWRFGKDWHMPITEKIQWTKTHPHFYTLEDFHENFA